MINTKLSNLNFKFREEKFHFLTQCYVKTKITSKQLCITSLHIDKHSDKLNQKTPRSLKRSIPYSQTFRLKTICATTTEFDKNCAIIKQKLLDR